MARKKKAVRPYRSKFEEKLGAFLDGSKVPFTYETETYQIQVAVPGVKCQGCGETKNILRATRYTPDFFLPKWVIEAKGRFTGRDRKRVMALLASKDWNAKAKGRTFGMLFMRDNALSKTSKTRYSDWCTTWGVPYAIGTFKQEWLK